MRQCSGGERQRIALARALASDPEILFFDEPLSAIDYQLRRILEVEMKDLHRQTGKTFIYITHSLEEAMVMSDRIAILQAGRIVQAAAPREIYAQPANRFVAGFMGEVNIFAVAPGEHGSLTLPEVPVTVMSPGDRPPEPGYLVVRPERLRLLEPGESADVAFTATILNDYVLGSRTQLHARLRGQDALGRDAVGEEPAAARAGAAARLRPRRRRLRPGMTRMTRQPSAGIMAMTPIAVLLLIGFAGPLAYVAALSVMPPRTFGLAGEPTLQNYATAAREGTPPPPLVARLRARHDRDHAGDVLAASPRRWSPAPAPLRRS